MPIVNLTPVNHQSGTFMAADVENVVSKLSNHGAHGF